jgi:hypothetical protein
MCRTNKKYETEYISFFSLQLAMTLAREEESEVGEWEEFQRTHLGDTTGLSE